MAAVVGIHYTFQSIPQIQAHKQQVYVICTIIIKASRLFLKQIFSQERQKLAKL